MNPPDSPEFESPLQGSLHSVGSSSSSGGNIHDDFVMVDFVSPCKPVCIYRVFLVQQNLSHEARVNRNWFLEQARLCHEITSNPMDISVKNNAYI